MTLTETQRRQVGEVAGDRQHGVSVLLASDTKTAHDKMLAAVAKGDEATALGFLHGYAAAVNLRSRLERVAKRLDAVDQTETG
jgi:hypothetical protein